MTLEHFGHRFASSKKKIARAERERERGYSLLWFLTAELGELLNIRRTPRMTRSVVASRTYRAGVPYQIWN